MKSSSLAFAWFVLVVTLLQPSAAACDHCKSKCSQCDNRGLLDLADSFFGKLHSQTKKLSCGCKPTSKGHHCDHAPSCGSEMKPSCGCEAQLSASQPAASPPSCGCEIEPSCGCESQPSCGCDSGSGQHPPQRLPHAAPAPVQTHQHLHYPPQQSLPPAVQTQPPIQVPEAPAQRVTPDSHNFTPAPPPPSLRPTPDSAIDPFMDDAAARVRKIPAHAIQHSRELPYGDDYDPQASSQIRYRLNDNAGRMVRPEDRLATNSSSRTSAARTAPNLDRSRDNVVVTASGTMLRPITTTNARRLPSTTPPANPLRP